MSNNKQTGYQQDSQIYLLPSIIKEQSFIPSKRHDQKVASFTKIPKSLSKKNIQKQLVHLKDEVGEMQKQLYMMKQYYFKVSSTASPYLPNPLSQRQEIQISSFQLSANKNGSAILDKHRKSQKQQSNQHKGERRIDRLKKTHMNYFIDYYVNN